MVGIKREGRGRTSLPDEPATDSAKRALVGRLVRKFWPSSGPKGEGAWFNGVVKSVDFDKLDVDGKTLIPGALYEVEYEDGDSEDLFWADVAAILVPLPEDRALFAQEPNVPPPEASAEGRPAKQARRALDAPTATAQLTDAPQPPPGARPARGGKSLQDNDENAGGDNLDIGAAGLGTGGAGPAAVEVAMSRPVGFPAQTPTQMAAASNELVRRATQLLPLEGSTHVPGSRTVGNPGHLISMVLEDFMCHENLHADFGPHVTLISGTNGSGKSAIMQGLQCCLGASAKETGRAANLKQYIRTGTTSARVAVKLYNKGPDAYQPEVYGHSITIERRITQTSNPFRVLGHDNKVRTTTKRDVDLILEHYNLNAANPLTVITQDSSRSFLSGGKDDARKKYAMFMEGTQIADYKDIALVAKHNLQLQRALLLDAKAALVAREGDVAEVERKLAILKDAETLSDQLEQLTYAVTWAKVKEAQMRLQEKRHQTGEEAPAKVMQAEAQVEALTAQMEQLREQEAAATEALARSNEESHAAAAELKPLLQTQKQAAKAVKELVMAITDSQQVRKQHDEELQSNLTELNKDKNAATAAARQRVQEFEAKMAPLQQRLDSSSIETHNLEQQLVLLGQQITEKQQQLRLEEGQVARLRSKVQRSEQDVQELRSASQDRVYAFGGERVVRLRDAIRRNAHRFSAPPIGPVGYHLTLTDSKWSTAVEGAIGAGFNDFICANFNDAQLLKQLSRDVGMDRLTCHATNFNLPQHSANRRPPPAFTTVCDVVQVDGTRHPNVIFNQLVDRGKVEKTVLVDNHTQGRDIIYSNPCIAGDHFSTAWDMIANKYCKNGPLKYVEQSKRPRARLGMSSAEQLAQAEELLQHDREQLAAAQAVCSQLLHELRNLQQQEQMLKLQHNEARRVKHAAQQELRNLSAHHQDASYAASQADDDEGATFLATQVEAGRTNIAEVDAALAQLDRDLGDAKLRWAEASARVDGCKNANQQRVDTAANARQQLDSITERKEQLLRATAQATAALAQYQQHLELCKQDLEHWQPEVEGLLQVAAMVCSEEDGTAALQARRVTVAQQTVCTPAFMKLPKDEQQRKLQTDINVCMLPKKLEEEKLKVERKIKETKQSAGLARDQNEADLVSQLAHLKTMLADKRRKFDSVRKKFQMLHKSAEMRQAAFEEMQKNVLKVANDKFQLYMGRRDHVGRIELNEEAEELRLLVKIRGRLDPKVPVVSDLKQLSGGERSYTTVAFLLALGYWTDSPFRCFDEFDVFMDAINRRVATETLLQFALENDGYQFIFLTPQDIQAVEDAKHELERKERRKLPDSFLRVVQMKAARPNAGKARAA